MTANYIAMDYRVWSVDNTGHRDWITVDILLFDTRRGRLRLSNGGFNSHVGDNPLPRQEVVGYLCRAPNSESWSCVARPGWEYLLFNLVGRSLGYSLKEAVIRVRSALRPILSSIPKLVIRPRSRTSASPSWRRQLDVYICSNGCDGGGYSEVRSGLILFEQKIGLWRVRCIRTELNGLELVRGTEAQVRIDLARRWPWHWLEQHWSTYAEGFPRLPVEPRMFTLRLASSEVVS